jgi:hypothetical protein
MIVSGSWLGSPPLGRLKIDDSLWRAQPLEQANPASAILLFFVHYNFGVKNGLLRP